MASMPDSIRSSTGWDPNVVAALAYVAGCVSGIAVLFIEKDSRYVRFHAMQSTITFVVVAVAALLVSSLPLVAVPACVALVVAVAVLWFFLMYKALNGQRYKLPYIGDIAEQKTR
jgi:uncharacterized membrane protein